MRKKSYIQNLEEISKEELLEGLIGYGLFADKLPPFLTSKKFYDFCILQKESFFEKKAKRYTQYESMRNINIPRVLAIPNPIAYRNLCNILSENWSDILEHFRVKTANHKYKVSRIHVRKINNSSKIYRTCYASLNEYADSKVNYWFDMKHKNFCVDDYPELDLLINNNFRGCPR